MSTDHQRYSTENQAQAIRDYAARRGMQIVRTYADEGKSGLQIKGRDALKQLIETVTTGKADFEAILVYDVSRWGRFQDADESAYYEYICRRSGIAIHYCAEQFDNDGGPISTIVKSVKRAMAGEYSRELSGKVFAGQCRLIEKGFRQGGPAGYGLRRLLIDQHGSPRATLQQGEQKSLQTDRVVLIPGPEDEVAVVADIYRAFVVEGRSEQQISDWLNVRGIQTDLGRSWTRGTVHQLLINEKYIGPNVWNRVSFKLKKKRVRNDPETWIRAPNSFPALIDPEIFEAAKKIIAARSARMSDDEMLSVLQALLQRQGALSGLIIDEAQDTPSSSAYGQRFGSLLRAYQLVGYRPRRDYSYIEINRSLRRLHPGVIDTVLRGISSAGGAALRDETTDIVTVNGEFTLSLLVVRCSRTQSGALRWRVRMDTGLLPDISVVIRMDELNRRPLDYFFFPMLEVGTGRLRLAEDNGLGIDGYRFDSLDPLYALAARRSLRETA
jgi:DNA invertase Pin-like site-specific DNA recombinase